MQIQNDFVCQNHKTYVLFNYLQWVLHQHKKLELFKITYDLKLVCFNFFSNIDHNNIY